MYTGPTNGGVMPLDNSVWPLWSDGMATYPGCPLAASKYTVDGRTSRGSIDDYWVYYGSTAPDPYITAGWPQHTWGEAIGDYMKTSQFSYENIDGATSFFNYSYLPIPLTCGAMESYGVHPYDGTYGRKLFYEARGYKVTDCYSQKTDNTIPGGFSFAQFKAEIDAGRPVMLNLTGHTAVGVGYDNASYTIYIHDTWDYGDHIMTWGGTYYGMALHSASVVNVSTLGVTPFSRWETRQGCFWDQQQWVSGDFNGDGRTDLAKAFNHDGRASLDVHLSTGGGFSIGRWATRQGCFLDAQKWMAGDFNGDGLADFAKAFNCGNGLACIDVHLSTGSSFVIQRWATNQGWFWDRQKWRAGDFNGDGLTDLAKVFDHEGRASIDVHLSSGSAFSISRWATRQGDFWDKQKWMTGDFNGDGLTDFAKAFDSWAGLANIDVHWSTGATFEIARWNSNLGGFSDAQKWGVGDFNGDQKADLFKSFQDGGLGSTDIFLSMGNHFEITIGERQVGGFWDQQKWIPGDYDGDNVSDIANVFDDSGWASIDVHL